MPGTAKWTCMIYMAGDNSLSDAVVTDLSEMRKVASTPDVHVVVQYDQAQNKGARRFLLQKEPTKEDPTMLGVIDSGDPKTLLDFVDWALGKYKAERYALVLWNHGSGWAPWDVDTIARSTSAQIYDQREAIQHSHSRLGKTFFTTTLKHIFEIPSPSERAICSDDGSGHALDTVELGNVLAKVKKMLGQPLDLLGMDACLMSNIEVAYQASPYVNYIVGSEETEPTDGWPYQQVLQAIVDNPSGPTQELAAAVVAAYVKWYNDNDARDTVTQTALDLSKIDTVVGPLDTLADTLIAGMPKSAFDLWRALKKTTSFYEGTVWDIGGLCAHLGAESNTALRAAAQLAQVSVKPGAGNFIIAQSHQGAALQKCCGLSVYIPPNTEVSRFYKDLDFAKKHRWFSMLEKYQKV
ncbi:MAG TPA: clostripain-related cysteine peptidase [Chloroflexia bacterium]|nr:clostripain-related cysteine peptidase [Chloroflexia bacterium]